MSYHFSFKAFDCVASVLEDFAHVLLDFLAVMLEYLLDISFYFLGCLLFIPRNEVDRFLCAFLLDVLGNGFPVFACIH
jgi:hypothetical protein